LKTVSPPPKRIAKKGSRPIWNGTPRWREHDKEDVINAKHLPHRVNSHFLGVWEARKVDRLCATGAGKHEDYGESRLRERRLARFKHWEEIQVRLQHRWPPDRVIRWHQDQWPSEPCPPKTTLFRHVKSKPPGWFISRLVHAESGMRTVHRQLVAERQAELIETMIMRLQVALKFEKEMNGILIPEVTRNLELLDRMLMDHFRVLQELGIEPKRGSMAPG
jgi:hypothetical protein